ncbi:AraC family transcriptional regulator [uncultured Maribacter sp.]|uniref:AraC family transcriptional regulator n=1 Tax=uncultured Maribacter sp. TaxID=431308 RepID=UPI0026054B81|nr:AraC family transcriptional regulator [uncultured Maribacter sp.]
MRRLRILITFLFLFINLYSSIAKEGIGTEKKTTRELPPISFRNKADDLFMEQNYNDAIETYQLALEKEIPNKAPVLKKIALSYSALNKTQESLKYIEEYLHKEYNPNILADSGFDTIRETEAFDIIEKRYVPQINIWTFIYLYVALIGFYLTVIIHFNKKIDSIAKILISAFIFTHSIFIIHIFLFLTNYQFNFPNSYLISTGFSFLYGPLLYFYFKRITQQYTFKLKDLTHLIPTLLIFIYLIPKYLLPITEKLEILINEASGYTSENSTEFITIVVLKVISLLTYGVFIRKIYLKSQLDSNLSDENKIWKKNIYRIHFLYLICYCIYGFLSLNNISVGFFFNMQIFAMAMMILYLGYSANAQPDVFSGVLNAKNALFFKYQKSGLTDSLSKELKDNLIRLFDIDKIYKENHINLEMVATNLETTRHNASQVINEHFNMNFNELINWYRIREAKKILDSNTAKKMNMIDVAYEVGYNNKVTFNKAFKKETLLTPSQYQKKIAPNS